MTSYYSNHDLAAYDSQVANYQREHEDWEAAVAAQDAAYEQALLDYETAKVVWDENPEWADNPFAMEPLPPAMPTQIPEPPLPADPRHIYEGELVSEPQAMDTATGRALAMPGRWMLSADGGRSSFALSEQELAAGYTATDEIDLATRGQS